MGWDKRLWIGDAPTVEELLVPSSTGGRIVSDDDDAPPIPLAPLPAPVCDPLASSDWTPEELAEPLPPCESAVLPPSLPATFSAPLPEPEPFNVRVEARSDGVHVFFTRPIDHLHAAPAFAREFAEHLRKASYAAQAAAVVTGVDGQQRVAATPKQRAAARKKMRRR